MQFYACISGSEFVTSNLNFAANSQKSTTLVIGFCWKWMPFDRNIIFYSFYQYPEIFLTKVLRLVSFLHFCSFFRLHAVRSYQSRAHTNKHTANIVLLLKFEGIMLKISLKSTFITYLQGTLIRYLFLNGMFLFGNERVLLNAFSSCWDNFL